ncbi:MAG: ABC transporter permease [Patescibacteria group bacterium]|nr:ABC transporter permease [Patescibacteria group bacterium]
MRISDLFKETYAAITVNKLRTSLTILGIVIGISSVITLTSIGQGTQASIESRIQSIGSNLIIVMPGSQRGIGVQVSAGRGSAQSLTLADAQAISSELSGVSAVAPEVSRRYQATAPGKNTNTQVVGTVANYTSVRNVQVALGSFITDQNIESAAKVAVLGPTTRDDLFGENADPTGQDIRINKMNFKVIGVTVSKGGTGFGSQDDVIYIPISTAQRFLSGNENVSDIYVEAQDQSTMSDLQQQITDLLLSRHNISNPQLADFSTLNQADLVATATAVTSTLTILLGAIAGISLLVGGIGIMNMMLTSVTERTREIGLRKAIGAKRTDISTQFLAEAVTLTFLGGVFGIAVGWGASFIITKFFSVATDISLNSILLAFGVSAGIGIIFGFYPAQRAAKLNPIEALRFE